MVVCTDPERIRKRLASGEVRRVLAVRASRLGDLLMTTPALHAFRKTWPGPELYFLSNPYSQAILKGNPDVDRILILRGREKDLLGWRGRILARRLRGSGIDLLLPLRPRKELPAFAERAGIPLLWPPPELHGGDGHVVRNCFESLKPLGIRGEPGPLRLFLGEKELGAARSLLPPGRGPVALLHPGCDETFRWKPRSGVRRRVWPEEHWVELIRGLRDAFGARIVLSSGTRREESWVERIRGRCSPEVLHQSRLPLRTFCTLVGLADLVVTLDTGPLHIAAALDRPLLGLFGPSPPEYTGPWLGRKVVLRRDLPCSPCQGKGVRCLRNVCMEEIRPGAVLEAARDLIQIQG